MTGLWKTSLHRCMGMNDMYPTAYCVLTVHHANTLPSKFGSIFAYVESISIFYICTFHTITVVIKMK